MLLLSPLLACSLLAGPYASAALRTAFRHASPAMSVPLEEGKWEISTLPTGEQTMRVQVAGKELAFETGLMARQASGAVVVRQGDTSVFCAACFEKVEEIVPLGMVPLRVDYFERQSAAGRTPGGYIKRQGRASTVETLVCRLIDRPIRPLIDEDWCLETQVFRNPNRDAVRPHLQP